MCAIHYKDILIVLRTKNGTDIANYVNHVLYTLHKQIRGKETNEI
jgi:hypothetical protein